MNICVIFFPSRCVKADVWRLVGEGRGGMPTPTIRCTKGRCEWCAPAANCLMTDLINNSVRGSQINYLSAIKRTSFH